jgi:ribose transport system permease protein
MTTTASVRSVNQRRVVDAGWIARSGLAVWVIVAILLAWLTVSDPGRFWAPASIANVLTGMVVLGLVSLGQHVVVLSGGIDLSVGSLATLAGLAAAVMINGYPIRTAPVVIAVLGGGALIGSMHGWLVARVGIAPFVVTLATFYLLQGVAFTITTIPEGQVTTALASLGLKRVGPVPLSAFVLLIAVSVVGMVLQRTAFGRHVFAIGGDAPAAYAAGVPVRRVLVGTYALSGLLAAAAGVMLAARATVGSPTAGQGLELSAITVVVIGGTSLLGGRGRLLGTLGGVTLLSLMESSFAILQLPATLNDLIRGLVILAAASLFIVRRRR